MKIQTIKPLGRYRDGWNREVILFRAFLEGSTFSLIDFGFFTKTSFLANASPLFFLLSKNEQKELEDAARKLLSA